MKIGILGYGKEGQCAEKYFTEQGHEVSVFDNFKDSDLPRFGLNSFNMIMRSPSVHPQPGWSSMTKYFFNHCPCPIIGVTGTKGKGTTCSLITALFEALGQKVWLVGNIGTPALEVLDQIDENDVVVYEMSSFQLWDLEKSPHIAVVLGIEPDHLNVHDSYEDYINAKANITKYQTINDICVYNKKNPDSKVIAKLSKGQRIAYPMKSARLQKILNHLAIPGEHNRSNAEAAILAVAAYYGQTMMEFIRQYPDDIKAAFARFNGLPHRLQKVHELNHVKYYDDNFATTPSSLAVALNAFPERQVVLIAGGRDKTGNADLPEILQLIEEHKVAQVVLIGESGHAMAASLPDAIVVESLAEAIDKARAVAEEMASKVDFAAAEAAYEAEVEAAHQAYQEELAAAEAEAAEAAAKMEAEIETPTDDNEDDEDGKKPKRKPRRPRRRRVKPVELDPMPDLDIVVLMSPAAASFDMFDSVYDRGDQFTKLVQGLK